MTPEERKMLAKAIWNAALVAQEGGYDAIEVAAPGSFHTAAFMLSHRTPAPLRLAFLRSLAHAAEELAEQIELHADEARLAAEYTAERGHDLPREERAANARTGFARTALATTDSEYADKANPDSHEWLGMER